MRYLLLQLLASSLLICASIDTRLYEQDQRDTYYQQIEKQIADSEASGSVPNEIIRTEKSYLGKLKSIVSQKAAIETYDLQEFAKAKRIKPETFYQVIGYLGGIELKLANAKETIKQLQSKISYTKQKIENLTEEEKAGLLTLQLQFAFYKLQQSALEERSILLQEEAKRVGHELNGKIGKVVCKNVDAFDEAVAAADGELERLAQKKISIEIQRESELIDDSKRQELIQEKLNSANRAYREAIQKKITLQMHKAVCLLSTKQNKEFFKLLGGIEEQTKILPKELRTEFEEQRDILVEIAKDVFGTTRLFLGATKQELSDMLQEIKGYTTSTLFVFNEQPVSLVSLLKALMLIIFSFVLGNFYKRWVSRLPRRWPDMSQMSVRLTSNIGYYLIVIVGLMVAISSIGIDMTSISLIAGALSIGIGFGLQTVVSNLIAGIILMFERTIRIGDTIEISDTLRGRVVDMRIRSTTIKTFDNIDIVVPNSSFIQNNVVNWTLEDRFRRLRIPFGVAYGTDVEKVRKVVLDELAASDLKYIHNDADKMPDVWMVAMNSSSVDFELLVWIEWANQLRPNALKSEFLILIYNALNKHGIQIPFPQLDLHVKEFPRET